MILNLSEYDWEKKGMHVNEGSIILKRTGNYISFIQQARWEDEYAMGMLTGHNDSNLLDGLGQNQSISRISKSEKNGVYGPGHNSFVKSKDGNTRLDRIPWETVPLT